MTTILNLILSIDPRVRIAIAILILTLQVFVLFFPTDLFMMYLSLIYGTFTGVWINIISFFGMTWLGYEIGRLGKLGVVENEEDSKMIRVRRWIDKYGMRAVIINRLVPLIPINFVSYGSGIADLDRKRYMLVSFVCTLPWAFIWAYVGGHYLQMALKYMPADFNPGTLLLGFLIFMILATVITIIKRITNSSSEEISE